MGRAELNRALGAVVVSDASAELGEVGVYVDDFAFGRCAGGLVELAGVESDPATLAVIPPADLIPSHSLLH